MEWISVDERLPHNTGDVLVVVHYSNEKFVFVGRYYEDEDDLDNDGWDVHEHMHHSITHWMPLPLPPEDLLK